MPLALHHLSQERWIKDRLQCSPGVSQGKPAYPFPIGRRSVTNYILYSGLKMQERLINCKTLCRWLMYPKAQKTDALQGCYPYTSLKHSCNTRALECSASLAAYTSVITGYC